MTYPYVGIDIETTGFSSKDEIIEVAAIQFNLDGKIADTFHQLCWPSSGEVPEAITELTGLTIDHLHNAPNYMESVRAILTEFIGDRTVVAHNTSFDLRFLKIEGLKSECTLKICRRLNEEKTSNKLSEACKRYNIEWLEDQSHTAEYDAIKAMELFCKLREVPNYLK